MQSETRVRFMLTMLLTCIAAIVAPMAAAESLGVSAYAAEADDESRLEGEIMELYRQQDLTGLSIAVVKGDSIIYERAFGYREIPGKNSRKGEQLASDDIFKIASVSKTFVATAIMKLQEQGVLSLKDDAQKYLDFPLRNPHHPDVPITIEQLIVHTSSVNDRCGYTDLDSINPAVNKDYKRCYFYGVPDKYYNYSNMNYTLLGAVIEGAAGERFDDVIDRLICQPLGLNAGYNVERLDSTKFVNLYYYLPKYPKTRFVNQVAYKDYPDELGKNYQLGKSVALEVPAGGMKISAPDLAKFMIMHMQSGEYEGKRIISKKSEKLMRKNYVGKYNYGLSFRRYDFLGKDNIMYGQTGGASGIKSAMIFNPDKRYGFVILSTGNTTTEPDGFEEIHMPLIKILNKHLIENE